MNSAPNPKETIVSYCHNDAKWILVASRRVMFTGSYAELCSWITAILSTCELTTQSQMNKDDVRSGWEDFMAEIGRQVHNIIASNLGKPVYRMGEVPFDPSMAIAVHAAAMSERKRCADIALQVGTEGFGHNWESIKAREIHRLACATIVDRILEQ